MSRLVGSVAIRSCEKLVATCAVCVSTSADAADDLDGLGHAGGPIVTSTGTTCVGARVTTRS